MSKQTKVKVKDDIKTPLYKLLDKYQRQCGTDARGAVRDVLTQLRHFCATNSLPFNEIVTASSEVYAEHLSLDLPGDPIRAEVHSDDHRAHASFDARPWFVQAEDDEVTELAQQDWGGNQEADAVALMVAESDDAVSSVIVYVETVNENKMGFECHIDKASASRWIKSNNPKLWQKLWDNQLVEEEDADRPVSDKPLYNEMFGK